MPVKRRGRKAAVKLPAADDVDQATAEVESHEVPAKKAKTVDPPTPEPVKVEKVKVAEPEAQSSEAPAAESSSPKKQKPPTVSKWVKLKETFTKKEAKDFVHYMNQKINEDASPVMVTITIAVNGYVWSQTVQTQCAKQAKEKLAETVLDHFGLEDVETIHPDDFNIGPTPTGLLERFLGDNHSFTTEVATAEAVSAEDSEAMASTEEKPKKNPEHVIQLLVNEEVVDTQKVHSRSQSHGTRVGMAIKYITEHVEDYIRVISDAQNRAVMAQTQGQMQGQMTDGWKMGQGQMQNGMANGMAAMTNGHSAPNDAPADPLCGCSELVKDGSQYKFQQLKTIFKNCCFKHPMQTLYSHCGKNKIEFKLETVKNESETDMTWTTSISFEDASVSGIGPGKKSKEVAAVAALVYLKQQGKFDDTAAYINDMVSEMKTSNEDSPSTQVEYMRRILEEVPDFSTDDGIDVEIEERKVKEFTTTIDFAQIKGVGKSVNGKKASKKSALLDWIIKYERANKVKVEDIIKQYKEGVQMKKTEKNKEWLAGKKAAIEAKKAEKEAAGEGESVEEVVEE